MNTDKIEQKLKTALGDNVYYVSLQYNYDTDKINNKINIRPSKEITLNYLNEIKEQIESIKLTSKDYDREKTYIFGKVEVTDIKVYSDSLYVFVKLPITHVQLNTDYAILYSVFSDREDIPKDVFEFVQRQLREANPELTISNGQINSFTRYLWKEFNE